jgi:hypothetical protein
VHSSWFSPFDTGARHDNTKLVRSCRHRVIILMCLPESLIFVNGVSAWEGVVMPSHRACPPQVTLVTTLMVITKVNVIYGLIWIS